MITTVFVNTNLTKYRLEAVIATLVTFYTLVLIHQFGLNGVSSDELVAGFDARGSSLTILVALLIVLQVWYL
jgi:hypothetical protein